MGVLTLKSEVFVSNGRIPARYTCDGENISPPLAWSGAPAGTRSYALIVDDPDAPAGTWVHWVAWNIGAGVTSLGEGVSPREKGAGMKQGINDFRKRGYGGPCPPSGTHRYFFRLYALARELDLPSDTKRKSLDAAMKGHILAETQLVGVYSRGS